MFADDWFPIQVKQMDKVGRPDIDQFCHAMDRENRQEVSTAMFAVESSRGFYVAFDFSEDAKRECTRYHKQTGRIIKMLTVQEILDEEHVQKM